MQLHRPGRTVAVLSQPGQPDQQIAMPVRDLNACLAEELRRLDADEVYGEVITSGLASARITTRTVGEEAAEPSENTTVQGHDASASASAEGTGDE